MANTNRGGARNSGVPTIDASMGLIYRLNLLWNEVDKASLSGDTDRWNFVLDRIYANLLYRNSIEVEYDKEKYKTVPRGDLPAEIQEVKLAKEDSVIFDKLNTMIRNVKANKRVAIRTRNKVLFNKLEDEHYRVLMLKDVWLRKFMHERGLYMKEIDFNASNALFGG